MVLEDRDFIFHKALAEDSKKVLIKAHSKLEKKCLALYRKFKAIEEEYTETTDIKKLSKFSRLYKVTENSMISIFALKNRIEILIKRCDERIAYLNAKLKEAGIYNEKVDRKDLSEVHKSYSEQVSEESINLNQNAEDGCLYKLINGEVYMFKDGKLSFENEFNQAVLLLLDSSEIGKIIRLFPYSVETVPVELILNTSLKQKILKEIASYVIEESKTKSITEINKDLGNLLSFKSEYTENATDYIAGVQNLFEVQVKQCLLERFPEKANEIAGKLRCNEKSELIPLSKINIAVFANGLSGEVSKDESKESEEVRLAQEKEDQNILEAMQLLSELLGEQEEKLEIEQEQQEENETNQKIAEEQLKKKQKEEQEQQEADAAVAELERMLGKSAPDSDD